MKYKEKIYTPTIFYNFWGVYCKSLSYRFRYDPVPGIKNHKNPIVKFYRKIKTTQERKWTFAHKEYVRPKRNFRNLPESWDDIPIARREKGWKRSKKKKQWM